MSDLSSKHHVGLTDRGDGSAMERTLSVVIADDHLLYRRGLASLLRRSGIAVVGEAPNGEVAITVVRETAPDVVVMDLNMPGTSGLEATRRLAADGPPVLILTVSAQDDDVTEALRGGAVGYLLKDSPVEDVVAAIRAAAGTVRTPPRPAGATRHDGERRRPLRRLRRRTPRTPS